VVVTKTLKKLLLKVNSGFGCGPNFLLFIRLHQQGFTTPPPTHKKKTLPTLLMTWDKLKIMITEAATNMYDTRIDAENRINVCQTMF
jgi:hypothetical protein